MPYAPDLKNRIEGLTRDLQSAITHSGNRAKLNHWTTIILMLVALLSSAAAGLGGIFFHFDPKLTGGLALIPGILALLATTMKFQGKANWHYRRQYALLALKQKLLYELPETPTSDDIAAISRSWSELGQKMQEEWERAFSLSLDSVPKASPGVEKPPRKGQSSSSAPR